MDRQQAEQPFTDQVEGTPYPVAGKPGEPKESRHSCGGLLEGDLNHRALSQDHPREIIPLLHEIGPIEAPERMAQGNRHWLSPVESIRSQQRHFPKSRNIYQG